MKFALTSALRHLLGISVVFALALVAPIAAQAQTTVQIHDIMNNVPASP